MEAARRCGIDISSKTALRWALHGTGGAKLESVRVGRRRMTSEAALRRFIEAQQPSDGALPVQVLDAGAAETVLAAHGIGRSVDG